MTLQEIITLLIQFPIIGIFIWYSDKKDKQFIAAADKRDVQFIDALEKQRIAGQDTTNKMLEELRCLRVDHENHHQAMMVAVTQMEERTRRARAR